LMSEPQLSHGVAPSGVPVHRHDLLSVTVSSNRIKPTAVHPRKLCSSFVDSLQGVTPVVVIDLFFVHQVAARRHCGFLLAVHFVVFRGAMELN
ncbi:hypothetical protein PIB30_080973, partial [Stylosanthes scabra]|nr:hypothetical protein [Stylosanthes scabra]